MKYLKNVSTLEFDRNKCKKCLMCTVVCPHGVFKYENNEIKITDRDRCMECGACVNNCPYDAIKVNKGVGCAEAIIYSLLTGKEPKCGCCED
ncbi:MAG: 4Fe-4S binding protein [Victivallales bacterium]|nr:4Fe-4S binding protein [Victivallales bacterium]